MLLLLLLLLLPFSSAAAAEEDDDDDDDDDADDADDADTDADDYCDDAGAGGDLLDCSSPLVPMRCSVRASSWRHWRSLQTRFKPVSSPHATHAHLRHIRTYPVYVKKMSAAFQQSGGFVPGKIQQWRAMLEDFATWGPELRRQREPAREPRRSSRNPATCGRHFEARLEHLRNSFGTRQAGAL